MELIDRYLQAVRFWLPKQQKQDIIAEISEDIHSQIEEQEASLGRKLNQPEMQAVLKARGRPVLVANRYLPQEHLIGPLLFPIYRFVLKIVLLCYLVPWAMVSVTVATVTGHGSALGIWNSIWSTAFIAFSTVTIVFAVLERVQEKTHFLEQWDPLKLPPIRNPNLVPRSASTIEVAANSLVLIWFAINMSSLVVMDQPGIRITLTPLWSYFYWTFLLLTLGNLMLACANLIRPEWTATKATLRLLFDAAGSVAFCWLCKVNVIASIAIANTPPERLRDIERVVNLWIERAFPFAVLVGMTIAVADVYRILRVKSGNVRVTQAATVIAVLLMSLQTFTPTSHSVNAIACFTYKECSAQPVFGNDGLGDPYTSRPLNSSIFFTR